MSGGAGGRGNLDNLDNDRLDRGGRGSSLLWLPKNRRLGNWGSLGGFCVVDEGHG